MLFFQGSLSLSWYRFGKDKADLTILVHLARGQAAHGGKKSTHGKVFKIKGLTKLLFLKEQKATLIVEDLYKIRLTTILHNQQGIVIRS